MDIEFLDPGPGDEPVEGAPVHRRLGAVPALAVPPLLVAAAALAVAAPFATLYRVSVSQGGGHPTETEAVDGWGRYTVNFDAGFGGLHGPRYGVVFVAAAVVLTAAAAVRGLLLLRPDNTRFRTAGTLLAVAGAAGLAAIAAVGWLTWQSTKDVYDAQAHEAGSNSDGLISTLPTPHVAIGACLWLAIAATAAALLAVAAALAPDRRQPPSAPEPHPAAAAPPDGEPLELPL
jgi:hypothetical protein